MKVLDVLHISIHSLHTEGDFIIYCKNYLASNFNPLPPHGGRRVEIGVRKNASNYFNPLPPHGGRPVALSGGDTGETFQSTPSTRRETRSVRQSDRKNCISIHSLHTEGDIFSPSCGGRYDGHFNPLPPHGGRLDKIVNNHEGCAISIHSLHTEGDMIVTPMLTTDGISIHSLHTEGDQILC